MSDTPLEFTNRVALLISIIFFKEGRKFDAIKTMFFLSKIREFGCRSFIIARKSVPTHSQSSQTWLRIYRCGLGHYTLRRATCLIFNICIEKPIIAVWNQVFATWVYESPHLNSRYRYLKLVYELWKFQKSNPESILHRHGCCWVFWRVYRSLRVQCPGGGDPWTLVIASNSQPF